MKPPWSADLVGVQRGAQSREEELGEEFVQDGDRTSGSAVRW